MRESRQRSGRDKAVLQNFTVALLRVRRDREALEMARRALAADAHDQLSMANYVTALQVNEDPAWPRLFDTNRFVRKDKIAPPPGLRRCRPLMKH